VAIAGFQDARCFYCHHLPFYDLFGPEVEVACGFDLIEAASHKITVNERRYPADLARGSNAKHTQLSNPSTGR
jgi:hypothetical protein